MPWQGREVMLPTAIRKALFDSMKAGLTFYSSAGSYSVWHMSEKTTTESMRLFTIHRSPTKHRQQTDAEA